MATTQTAASKKSAPAALTGAALDIAKKRNAKRASRAEHRKKLAAKLKGDKEFTKTYFEGRSKRANDKKSAFRKKKSKKK
jgi:hypothetical protein